MDVVVSKRNWKGEKELLAVIPSPLSSCALIQQHNDSICSLYVAIEINLLL